MFEGTIKAIKEARERRNARIDAINRVETALKALPEQELKTDDGKDKEAIELSKKTKLPYADVLAYLQQKRKTEKVKAKLKDITASILKAGKQSAMNIEQSGFLGSGSSIMKEKSMNDGDSLLDFSRVKNESMFGGTTRRKRRI